MIPAESEIGACAGCFYGLVLVLIVVALGCGVAHLLEYLLR